MNPAPVQDPYGLVGQRLEGKFQVERHAGDGHAGVVYQARHLLLDRPVAIKVFHPPRGLSAEGQAAYVEGFRTEARASAKLSHPHIEQALDFGVSQLPRGETAPWVVLEWLPGESFRDSLLARRGQGGRDTEECLELLRPVLDALAYAHDEGMAHRDIKPASMRLVLTRSGRVLKLSDFGIARALEQGVEAAGGARTQSKFTVDSLAYAAPEQVTGGRTGPWTDVHAMALIMTEVLTDQPAYTGSSRTEVAAQVVSPRRPTPGSKGVNVGPWERVLERALALDPSQRYQNAREFLEALENELVDEKPTGAMSRDEVLAALGLPPGSDALESWKASSGQVAPMKPMVPPGMPQGHGMAPPGQHGYGQQTGFPHQTGFPQQTGYGQPGVGQTAFPGQQGMQPQGYPPQQGYPPHQQGYPQQGYPQQGGAPQVPAPSGGARWGLIIAALVAIVGVGVLGAALAVVFSRAN